MRLLKTQTEFQNRFRFRFIVYIIFMIPFIWNSNAFPQSNKDSEVTPKSIAENYGINSFSQISSIKFTFNVKSQKINVKRTWQWEPKTGDVKFTGADENGKDTTISYNRNKLDTSNTLELYADKRFINDEYWLLFPFHLVWDNNVDITSQGKKEFPISHKKGNSFVVQYKNNVGYTPNDVFELYVGNDNMIKEWTYRPGGDKTKERSYTWEGNKKFGGITISTEHNGPGNKFRVWFTDVSVVTDHN